MNAMIIRGVALGGGVPKICVPLVGNTRFQLLREAESALNAGADLVEWRADHYEAPESADMLSMLGDLRKPLGNLPLLFTVRTVREGGECALSEKSYLQLNKEVIASGLADLVDVELFSGDSACREIIEAARCAGVRVVLSNHDFSSTPDGAVILERLEKMHALGADIPKIAVMPQSPEDVLTLLSATCAFNKRHPGPVITVSMGQLGVISRISGAFFGSAVTFGSAQRASAPGQLAAADLRSVLQILRSNPEVPKK